MKRAWGGGTGKNGTRFVAAAEPAGVQARPLGRVTPQPVFAARPSRRLDHPWRSGPQGESKGWSCSVTLASNSYWSATSRSISRYSACHRMSAICRARAASFPIVLGSRDNGDVHARPTQRAGWGSYFQGPSRPTDRHPRRNRVEQQGAYRVKIADVRPG